MDRTNKAHLVYLTGISLDKKRLNYINENINGDKDFSYWLNEMESHLNKSFSEITKHLERAKDGDGLHGKIYDAIDGFLVGLLGDSISGLSIKPMINQVFDAIGVKNLKEQRELNSNLTNLLINSHIKLKKYQSGDFFSLYLSHQSDSIGVMPLSQLAQEKNYNFIPSYSDRDFYDNRYIDHVTIKIRQDIIDTKFHDFKKIVDRVFKIHLTDIMLSNLLNDVEFEGEKEGVLLSFYDLVENANKEELNQAKQSLADRNFFGINLLSLFLRALKEVSGQQTFSVNLKGTRYDKENINTEFLKELLEFSSEPEMLKEKEHDETDLSFTIYSSNGFNLMEHNIKELIKERTTELMKLKSLKFIEEDGNYRELKGINKSYTTDEDKKVLCEAIATYESEILFLHKDESFQRMHNIWNLTEEERKNKLFDRIRAELNRIESISKENHSKYFDIDNSGDRYYYVKIPIKMVLSLPIDEKEKQNQKLHIPYMIDENKEQIDVMTVGGAEHNRALAHLINKHRQEYKDKRIFGFMDNYFDFEHKIKKTKIDRDIEYADSFLMGLNQPVSGFNAILNMRVDDGIGDSINSDVKILGYRLKVDTKTYNIVTIYGFSAVASVYGVHHIIADIDYNYNSKKHPNIFNNKYISELGPGIFDKDYINKGLTAIIFHREDINHIINDNFKGKSPLYIFNTNRELYMKVFREELVERMNFGFQSFKRRN